MARERKRNYANLGGRGGDGSRMSDMESASTTRGVRVWKERHREFGKSEVCKTTGIGRQGKKENGKEEAREGREGGGERARIWCGARGRTSAPDSGRDRGGGKERRRTGRQRTLRGKEERTLQRRAEPRPRAKRRVARAREAGQARPKAGKPALADKRQSVRTCVRVYMRERETGEKKEMERDGDEEKK